ncbi:MAG: Asp-tRNA(Asn)/Glu-tRNA(Gln) amidotransferase subunit GatB [Spirochaetes bacterium]|nr:Asp-tRNA(Asn)/Glu-tRNA(Gln) amidotransferase subunit GatB [Spirochaetota bacterium]
MNWEVVIGLEVHAGLSTKSKIFCSCSTVFGGEPNTQVCPVCSGMPGALPKLNRAVVEFAVKLGLVLGCKIAETCKFDRKNYFYPDLPKAYQVSQFYAPVCRGGGLEIEAGGGSKVIGIRQIHMEEDAGKLIHEPAGGTFMDFNRCGVPLLEIVSEPDFRSAGEVVAYLERLRETLLYLEICDCKMQEGSLRCDVNLSVRRPGEALGVRSEIKNLNSFKAVARAIESESARQVELLEGGGRVLQETRRWDDDRGLSFAMRSKENAQDYRYFPEPDLLPVVVDAGWLECIQKSLPELASEKRARYTADFAISREEAVFLTSHKNISDLFESLCVQSGEPAESAHLISGSVMQLMNSAGVLPEALSVDAGKLSYLIAQVLGGKINRASYKEVVAAVFTDGVDPAAYIAERGLLMQSDGGAALAAAQSVIDAHPGDVADYRAGKEKVFGFLMGQLMKKLGGSGNPALAKETLKGLLDR